MGPVTLANSSSARTDTVKELTAGDPAPLFVQRSKSNPSLAIDGAAGRYIVLCFFGGARDPHAKAAIKAAMERQDIFDDQHASFFGVSQDTDDEASGRRIDRLPGMRYVWDFNGQVAALYGAPLKVNANESASASRRWVLIDPMMRVIANIPFREDGGDIAEVIGMLEAFAPPECYTGEELQAPIIVLPRVFEPALCRELVKRYDVNGGQESGFMREVDGRTVGVFDHGFKQRKDYVVDDKALIGRVHMCFKRRVAPQIAKAYQFTATRMERHVVSCYAAEEGGHFAAHRDNTTAGTAHRRFAVSINLNDDFDGGEVSFPEFGPRSFKAPVGGAVVFSCSLLHSVSRVTRGRRYAFLPFLYDEAAAQIRLRNAGLVERPTTPRPVAAVSG